MKNSQTFRVTYTKKIGGESFVTVKASDEKEAIANAKQHVFTGSDFRNPVVVDAALYTKPINQGFHGSGRQN